MSEQFYSDYVDANGHTYKTVGENIRKGAKDVDTIVDSINTNTDAAKVAGAIHVTANELKTAIINLLSGKKAFFGGLDTIALTQEELAEIKTYLGIGA